MAHETQYWSFRYILGTAYSGKTEASEISPACKSRVLVLVLKTVPKLPKTWMNSGGGGKERTNSGTLDHVADCESLYRLILWCAARAVGAADRLDVSSSLLVATAVMDVLVSWVLRVLGWKGGGILGRSLFDHSCGSGKRSVRMGLE